MSKNETNIDPKMKTVFDMTRDLMGHEGKEYIETDIELDNEIIDRLNELSKMYGHDLETIVNGILSVAVNGFGIEEK